MDYKEAAGYFYSLNLMGNRMGLEREERLLSLLGNPEKGMKCVLVGGTSGKGSTTAMIASVLSKAGYKTGMFTKPHFSSFSERIRVDGAEIPEKKLAEIATAVRYAIEAEGNWPGGMKPTFFEVVVAIALAYFGEMKVDYAVLEVGMGGRLDATNVAQAQVSVITNVSLEHTEILGKTIRKIATEKGGIIKQGGVLVTSAEGGALEALRSICRKRGSKIILAGRTGSKTEITAKPAAAGRNMGKYSGQNFTVSSEKNKYSLFMPLLGSHQLKNAGCAIGAIEALNERGAGIQKSAVKKGFAELAWPGRLEVAGKNPLIVLDCAKDANAMGILSKEIPKIFKYRKLALVLSISSDKRYGEMIAEIAPLAGFIVCTAHKVRGRALAPSKIAEIAGKYSKAGIALRKGMREAVAEAQSWAGKRDLILVTGSVFAVAEAREILLGGGWRPEERRLNEAPAK